MLPVSHFQEEFTGQFLPAVFFFSYEPSGSSVKLPTSATRSSSFQLSSFVTLASCPDLLLFVGISRKLSSSLSFNSVGNCAVSADSLLHCAASDLYFPTIGISQCSGLCIADRMITTHQKSAYLVNEQVNIVHVLN